MRCEQVESVADKSGRRRRPRAARAALGTPPARRDRLASADALDEVFTSLSQSSDPWSSAAPGQEQPGVEPTLEESSTRGRQAAIGRRPPSPAVATPLDPVPLETPPFDPSPLRRIANQLDRQQERLLRLLREIEAATLPR